ncbi:MAG: PAS domain S-box protein, partial [Candidatus Aminicenantales bacterium]
MQNSGPRILLVEDEALIADDEARQLEKDGYCVSAVGTGERAVEFVRGLAGDVDLILMDINLGRGMDGTEAAREILKAYDIPILFLSVYTDRETVEKTEKVSSYGYVVKTAGIAVVSASIRMAISLHRALRELQATEEVGSPENDFENILDHVIRRHREHEVVSGSTALWKAALEATADGILIVAGDGSVSGYNTRFVEMWKLSGDLLSEINSDKLWASVADQLIDPDACLVQSRKLGLESEKDALYILEFKDGRVYEWYTRPQYLHGKPVGRVSSFRDVSASKRAEEALRDSEEKYRLVTSLMTDYFFRITLGDDGRTVLDIISANFPSITGRTIKDVESPELWPKFIHPDDLGGLLDLLRKLRTEGGEGSVECRSFVQGGRERWVHVAARVVAPSQNGKPRMIIGAVKDITERKRIEEELRESRRLLDDVQEISKVGGWEYNLETRRMIWTDELYRLNGVDKTFNPNDRAKV